MKKIMSMLVLTLLLFQVNVSIGKETGLDRIVYVREDIPSIPVKPDKGGFYEDMVPDTLDIAEMAEFAINGLTGPTDTDADHEIYFYLELRNNPATMVHDVADICRVKFIEALPLLRIITGSLHNDVVDRTWKENALKSIGPDGLYYVPLNGMPWMRMKKAWAGGIIRDDGTIVDNVADPSLSQFTHTFLCTRMVNTMLVYYLRDHNPYWINAIEQMIDRLSELAIYKDDYCYFPALYYEPNAQYDKGDLRAAMPSLITGGEINGRNLGLGMFYRLTGYEPARDLAESLTRFMRFHDNYFDEDGKFIDDQHFHAHAIYLISMLELALSTEDQELLEFVHKSYKWAQSPEAGASTLAGFFPEVAGTEHQSSEGCAIADMIAMALKFSAAGVGDYYEDAERWTRNHFAEAQLTRTKTAYIAEAVKKMPAAEVGQYVTAEKALESNIGAFASWMTGSDWKVMEYGCGIMHCCTGNCARSIYYIWEHMLEYTEGKLQVNMLMNRASPWADVYSYIPYEGQVDIKLKKTCKEVLVHAPEWIETGSDQIIAEVDGKPCQFRWENRYLNMGKIRKGKRLTLKFPISERVVTDERMGKMDYSLIIKGNTIVSIDPPGENYAPLYQRAHYRENLVRWRKVKRFVADDFIQY